MPTSIAVNNGKFYIGNLGLFPITPESSKVMSFNIGPCPWPFLFGFGCGDEPEKLRLSGSRAGFTTVVAVDFGPDGLLYALELNDAAGLYHAVSYVRYANGLNWMLGAVYGGQRDQTDHA